MDTRNNINDEKSLNGYDKSGLFGNNQSSATEKGYKHFIIDAIDYFKFNEIDNRIIQNGLWSEDNPPVKSVYISFPITDSKDILEKLKNDNRILSIDHERTEAGISFDNNIKNARHVFRTFLGLK